MIEQVLHRATMLKVVEQVKEDLGAATREPPATRRSADGPDLTPDDFHVALEEIEAADRREQEASSGQPGFELPNAERRGELTPPLDDLSFFSRDPVLSNLQSALEQALERDAVIEEAEPADDRRGIDEYVPVTNRRVADSKSQFSDGRRLFEQFSITDMRWVSSLFAQGIRLFRNRHGFVKEPAEAAIMPNTMRVLLVGDWGSGLPRAVKIAEQMRRELERGRASGIAQSVIHLGDVYYSGWAREYVNRLLRYWPVRSDEAEMVASYSLNGNHDMYSGGHAYYETLLADPRFNRWQGGCSFFSLHNDYWEIIGLDTAWEDESLRHPQVEWLRHRAASSPRKLLCLGHHQLFSAYESAGTLIMEQVKDLLTARRVHSWIWGHEHRCLVYNPHAGLRYSACFGHGGVPVYMWHSEDDPYPALVSYEYRKYIERGLERWGMFGFAVLEFENHVLRIRCIDEDGNEHRSDMVN